MAFNTKTGQALRDVVESHGEDGALRIVESALGTGKLRPEDFSIREIWEACNPGVSVYEANASGAFPKITGALINSKIISAYDNVPTIGGQLTQTVKSNVQDETIAGFTEVEGPEEVGEGMEYNDSTISEKYVTAHNEKFGRMLSVTEEMIYFDKTGQVLMRANRLGQQAAIYKEKLIVEGVQDVNTTVYRPSGVPTAFYSATNRNLQTTNAFGESGLEAIMKLAQTQKNDSLGVNAYDDFIFIDPQSAIVLVPVDLYLEAWQMANSALTPESAENAQNFWKGRFIPLTSPFISVRNTTTWYWGDFKQDFWWLEVWPLQVMTQGPGHEDEFKKDIKARFKCRFYGTIAGISTEHSYKSTT